MTGTCPRATLRPRAHAESLEPRTLLNAADLDPTFDHDGILYPQFNTSGRSTAEAVAFAGGGKVVLAGAVGGVSEDNNDLPAAARLNPDGSLDTTFGGDGWATVPLDSVIAGQATANAVAVQADGKVVIGGVGGYGKAVFLARFNADGALDSTFAGDGLYEFDPSVTGLNDVAILKVLPDGKILAAGGMDFVWVARFNPGGTLDTTFGFGGLTSADPTPDVGMRDRPQDLTLGAAGRVVVGGSAKWQTFDEHPIVVRFNVSGRIDTTFGGGDGVADLDLPRGRVLAVRARADNGIVAAGSATTGISLPNSCPTAPRTLRSAPAASSSHPTRRGHRCRPCRSGSGRSSTTGSSFSRRRGNSNRVTWGRSWCAGTAPTGPWTQPTAPTARPSSLSPTPTRSRTTLP